MSWPLQHPVLTAVVWPLVIMAIFIPLSVRRYRSQGASPTITDTIRVTQGPVDTPTAVHEAQRFEVDGLVTDPRDAV